MYEDRAFTDSHIHSRKGGDVGNWCGHEVVGNWVGKGLATCGKDAFPFPRVVNALSMQISMTECQLSIYPRLNEGRKRNRRKRRLQPEEVANIRERRKSLGMKQEELAGAAGISREFLSRIESGKKEPSEQVMERLEAALQMYAPDKGLRILFDYVRIRFPTTDAEGIVENVLGIKVKYMIREGHAFYSYSWQYVLGDIAVMFSEDEKLGTLLELHGKGCRQFEMYLEAQNRTWYDFFTMAKGYGGVAKRIDIAIDDRVGWLNVAALAEKCANEEIITLFRSWRTYQSGAMIRAHEDEPELMGCTLYLGTMKSDIYFCIYEKNYEQYVKNGTPLEETETKNRFEIRLKNDRAEHMLDDLLEHEEAGIGETAFAIINHYVRFLKADVLKPKRDWRLDEKWERFIGEGRRNIKLTTAPEPYTLERSLNWLARQVAPTLKMVKMLDKAQAHEDRVELMIERAKLGKNHELVIKQQQLPVEALITENCMFMKR